jgi:3-deoxy-7-phosphoheptulonate synthase
MPVGFKNGTDGNVQIAVDAIRAAMHPHQFLSVTKQGLAAIVVTRGNDSCHVILRGGHRRPNYHAEDIEQTAKALARAGLPARMMVDCSHGNSGKDHTRQPAVARDIAAQISDGSRHVFGVMVESHLVAGRQDVRPGVPLVYGQSVTDACLGWDDTLPVLEDLAKAVRARREKRHA